MTLEEKVVNYLKNKNLTLSIAESCTGGLVSHRITQISGSSDILKGSIVAYSNAVKEKILKVPENTIEKNGAVSSPVAMAMAKGVRKSLKTDFGIGITGIAGPTGGTKKKPVGTTFIAVATKNETLCLQCLFAGKRDSIKAKAASKALELLLEFSNE